jgi:hypothetical protein
MGARVEDAAHVIHARSTTSEAFQEAALAVLDTRCTCDGSCSSPVSGHPTHDFFFGQDQPVRPFNSIYFSACLEIKLSCPLKGGFFAWTAPTSPVLIEPVSVVNFPIRHLAILP